MSAFLVDDYHINALVSWAAGRHGHQAITYYWSGSRRDIRHDPRRVASVLFAENVRSVNARYSRDIQMKMPISQITPNAHNQPAADLL